MNYKDCLNITTVRFGDNLLRQKGKLVKGFNTTIVRFGAKSGVTLKVDNLFQYYNSEIWN